MNIQKDNAMQQIRTQFDEMSKVVLQQLDLLEKIINGGVTVISDEMLKEMNANEERTDQYEVQITDDIIDVIVLQKPVASDLRQVMAVYQMVANLERIGDSVMNIIRYIPRIQDTEVYLKMSEVITNMLMASVSMVRKSILSFVSNDKEEAIWTIKNDVVVDEMNHKLIKKAITKSKFSEEIQQLLFTFIQLNSIISTIERIADHATNIAEASIYAIEGKDLRHQKDIDE
ncbi:MAG: PhoU domain-containing protein [Bacteroidota bacterium]|nr:PhoU domain-containing protein [Bacteroidota bacterium]